MSNLKVEQARKLSIPRLPPSERFRSSSVTSSTIGASSLWFGHRKSSATKSDTNCDLSSVSMTNPSHPKQQHHGGGSNCANVSKRRHSSFGGGDCGKHNNLGQFKRRKKESGIIPPTKFLLGGNINDPLNLNGLNDGEIGRVINQVTPQTSPLPVPKHHTKVEVLIPPNINDPLNLNAGEDDAELELNLVSPKLKKRSRRKKRKSTVTEGSVENVDIKDKNGDDRECEQDVTLPTSEVEGDILNSSGTKSSLVVKPSSLAIHQSIQPQQVRQKKPDKIVSPVIPQPRSRKRRPSGHIKSNVRESECESGSHQEKSSGQVGSTKPKNKFARYCYGNYDRYYGYRNPELGEDSRLHYFKKEWFEGKDVLDIGCNIGHITLSIARDFSPKKIIGLDIDYRLVKIAKKNVFHYLRDDDKDGGNRFPVSLPICYGPITTAAVLKGDNSPKFPNNSFFIQVGLTLLFFFGRVNMEVIFFSILYYRRIMSWSRMTCWRSSDQNLMLFYASV